MENFNSIYEDHYDVVLNYITYKVNHFETAQELTNDVFLKVHEHLDSYDEDKSAIKTWVLNIAKNKVIDFYRKANHNDLSLDELAEDENLKYNVQSILLTASDKSPQQIMEGEEIMKVLQSKILSLPKKYKRVANLRFNHGMKLSEIVNKTGYTVNDVKVIIHRAKEKLEKKIFK